MYKFTSVRAGKWKTSDNIIEEVSRVGLIAETRGSKTALILDILEHFQGEFSIQELQELCPTVGID